MSSYDEIPDELIEYVEVKSNGYLVKKGSVDGGTIFGKFNSLKEACAAACILYKNNWKLMDVVLDPLVNYGGEFWVFKVEKNKLIFDNKFDNYETAVEYMEINSRCNEYHNDIFRNSSKKKGYKERYKSSKNEDENSKKDKYKYIFKVSNKFHVKKSKRKNSICYGEFNSIDEAIVARKILLDSNWYITNEHEIIFYNNYYWVFEVSEGILTFKGKSQSYEDALDMLTPPESQKESENTFIKAIDENYEKVMANRKKYDKLKSANRSNSRNIPKSKLEKQHDNTYKKIKTHVDESKVWKPSISKNLENKKIKITVKQPVGNKEKKFVLDFDIYYNNITCKVNGESILWEKRYTSKFKKFEELPLIIKILEINQFDILKLQYSSSIYYYNSFYYKIHLLNKNTLIFDKFDSYNSAMNNPIELKGVPLKRLDSRCPLDIDKNRGVYEMVTFQNGNVFKIGILKSLDEIKAIRDILILSKWNLKIFKKYELFYLNGFYWEITLSNNTIFLIDRYEIVIFI